MKNKSLIMLAAVLICIGLALSSCEGNPAPENTSQASTSESLSESGSQPEASSEPESASPEESSSEAESSSSQPQPSSSASPASEPSSQAPASSSSSQPEASSAAPPPEQPKSTGSAPANLRVAAPSLSDDGEYLKDVESEVIDLINQERERLGMGLLTYDPNLRSAARIRSAEMYENDFFSHIRPNGEKWSTVLKVEVPVSTSRAGENIAAVKTPANYDKIESANYWYNQWEGSPSHYEAMTDPAYTHVGVGIAYVYDGSIYHGYATTLFAAY